MKDYFFYPKQHVHIENFKNVHISSGSPMDVITVKISCT